MNKPRKVTRKEKKYIAKQQTHGRRHRPFFFFIRAVYYTQRRRFLDNFLPRPRFVLAPTDTNYIRTAISLAQQPCIYPVYSCTRALQGKSFLNTSQRREHKPSRIYNDGPGEKVILFRSTDSFSISLTAFSSRLFVVKNKESERDCAHGRETTTTPRFIPCFVVFFSIFFFFS